MFICKPHVKFVYYKLLGILLIAASFSLPIEANETSEAKTITTAFTTSGNSVEKSQILFSLKKYQSQKPLWVKQLLLTAINDKSPVVAAEAVYQIGAFGFNDCNAELIKLYKIADKRFGSPGYVERVHCAIIPVLGKTGNSEAKKFISGLLQIDKGSYKGGFLLEAVEELNDPVFIDDLKQYCMKLEKYVQLAKESGRDPFLYSEKVSYIERTKKIEKLLLKGGK